MKLQFDHIGIFCKNLKFGSKHIHSLFQIKKKSIIIIDRKLKLQFQLFFDESNICYELVADMRGSTLVKNTLKRKSFLNHIAYKTSNFNSIVKRNLNLGCIAISKKFVSKVFKDKKIIFLLSPLGIIVEIIEF